MKLRSQVPFPLRGHVKKKKKKKAPKFKSSSLPISVRLKIGVFKCKKAINTKKKKQKKKMQKYIIFFNLKKKKFKYTS
jgi:hypothetical protein